MKILALVRTLNEERNIERFCRAYTWADGVLVADGGSDDDTLALAGGFPNVTTRDFPGREPLPGGHFNPQGKHLNFLIEWGLEEGADWLIFDDCDCAPNPRLQTDGRAILEHCRQGAVGAFRLHMWGEDAHFPKMSLRLGEGFLGSSLWAWRPARVTIRGNPRNLQLELVGVPRYDDARRTNLPAPPYCLLHDTWPDEERVKAKLRFLHARNISVVHPLEGIYAPPEPLPEWVWD